jgi:hypothetical protein
MNPLYVTQSSSGPGPWKPANLNITPPSFAWSMILVQLPTQRP